MTTKTAPKKAAPASELKKATSTKRTARKAAAARPALLDRALASSSMSTATEDLLTSSPAWQPGETSELRHLDVMTIHPAADNPRANLGDLTGLADSIKAVGILEPILVRPSPLVTKGAATYQIVAGHRRHAAARLAGLDLVPCIVRTFTEQARIEAMVIENLQRSDLTPFDEARGLAQLVAVGLTQRDIAERVGCSQSHVSKRLSLAVLPPAAEKLFVDESLSVRQVEELAKVPDDDVAKVVDKLVTRAKGYKDTLLPDWAIDNEITKLKNDRKHAEALKAGKASGLVRLDDRPYDYTGSPHRKCKRADATHWFLGSNDISVMWARTAAAHDAANPPKPKADQPMSQWELREAAGERIAAFIDVRIYPAVTASPAARAVFISSVHSAARRSIDDGYHVAAETPSPDVDGVNDLDDELYIAFALLVGMAAPHWHPPVLELFIAHGYRTTGEGETFPDGFDPTPILITETEAAPS